MSADEIQTLEEKFQLDLQNQNNGPAPFTNFYTYLNSLVAQHPEVGAGAQYWYTHAQQINAGNADDLSNLFIRGVTAYGYVWDGIEPESLQAISSSIASTVYSSIVDKGSLLTIDDLTSLDVSAAISKSGMTTGGWGGSFYYWNSPFGNGQTVGQQISGDPAELEKFISVNAEALVSTLSAAFESTPDTSKFSVLQELAAYYISSTTGLPPEGGAYAVSGLSPKLRGINM